MADKPKLTTDAGAPVPDNQNSLTAGPRGPLLIQDYQLLEKLGHQNRERIPERTVHAKGWGLTAHCVSPGISASTPVPRCCRKAQKHP